MRSIRCRKCGAVIDPSQGECPVCGALYYVIPETDDPTSSPAGPAGEDAEATRLFRTVREDGNDGADYTRIFRNGTPAPGQPETRRTPPSPPPPPGGPGTPRPTRASSPPPRSPKLRRSRRIAGYIVGATVLLAVLAVLLSVMSGAFDFSGKSETMPLVTGMTKTLATETLKELGLSVKTRDIQSTESAGIVVEQSIPEGQELKEGMEVLLSVSTGSGPETGGVQTSQVTVPELSGYTYDDAKDALAALGLSITKNEPVYSDDVAEGLVVSQEPASGQSAETGSFVKVTLSKGKEPAEEYIISVTVGKGGSVSPRGRVSVAEGDSVTFVITPDEGYEVREARIDGAGLGPMEEYTFYNVTDNHTFYVIFQTAPESPEPSPTESPEPSPTESPAATETPAPEETPTPTAP